MDFNECVQRGIAFYQDEKFDMALDAFKAALNFPSNNADISHEDIKGMIEGLEMQIKGVSDASRQKADFKGTAEEDKEIAEYSEALKRNPNDASAKDALASAHYRRGLAFTSIGEHAKSIDDYSRAICYEPNYIFALKKRGWAYLEVGDYDKAIEDFEKIQRFHPNDANARENLATAYSSRGMAYDQNGDYACAISDYKKVLCLTPDDDTTRELLEIVRAERAKGSTVPPK